MYSPIQLRDKLGQMLAVAVATVLFFPTLLQAEPRDTGINLKPGLNLFSYPVKVPQTLSCTDMQAALQAASLTRLDAQNQRYETCQAPNANFPILPGTGYVLEMADSGQLTLSGETDCPQLNLSTGLNLVGVPSPPAGLTCFEMLHLFSQPESISAVQKFDIERGVFEACAFDANGETIGKDFPIVAGEAYLISMLGTSSGFNPNDTSLCTDCPDPVITSVSPITGPVGSMVTITGTNLDCGIPVLSFNGGPLPILSLSPTVIETVLPTGAQDGQFSLTINGRTVFAPSEFDFDITPSRNFDLVLAPADASVLQSSRVNYQVTANSLQPNFSDAITLTASGLPTGIQARFLPETITAGQASLLVLTADSGAPVGTEIFTVTGQALIEGIDVSHSAVANLEVLEGGRTSVQGRFVFNDDQPMVGVKVTFAKTTSEEREIITDGSGSFRFIDVPAGLHTLSIDTTPIDPVMPMYAVDVTLTEGQLLDLPPFVHYPLPPPEAFTPLTQAAAEEQVFTSINAPGATLTLPAGATIVGWDGIPKEQLAIVRKDPDKLPVLPPPGPTKSVYHPMFGTPMGGVPSEVMPVTAPNDLDMAPGEVGDLWYYDAAPIPGEPGHWVHGGTGTVSADGQTIVSDPGSGIGRFCGVCGLWCFIKRQLGLPDWNPFGPNDGDPVDLALGQMVDSKTDLILPGRVPAVVERTYNPYDPFGGIAGVQLGLGSGWTLTFDVVLQVETADLIRLILPGNARYAFHRQPDGTFIDTQDNPFSGAVLSTGTLGHKLRLKDGRVWEFDESTIPGLNGVEFLVAQVDRNGNRLAIERNATDKITRVVEPSGRALLFSYGANGLISEITDPIGRKLRYTYSGKFIQSVTDPAGEVTSYTYDTLGRLLTISDPRGIQWLKNEYDATIGRLTQQTEADGGQWGFEYLRPCNAGEVPRADTDACTVQTNRDVTTSAVVTDPRGSETQTEFSAVGGYANGYTDALGQRSRIERDNLGRILSVIDPLNRVTGVSYDDRSNPVAVTDSEGNVTHFEYEDQFSQVTKVTDALGNVTQLAYDANGNLIQITDPLGQVTHLGYDPFGQLTSITDALNQTTTYEYDAHGNRTKATDPLGNIVSVSFDAVSRPIAITDQRGLTTRVVYDEMNQVVDLIDPHGQHTRFTYDGNGNLLTVTDALNHTTTYVYDEMDRVVERIDPLGVSETFVYDKLGNLVQHTDRKGQISGYDYDPAERLTRASYADSTVDYVYDVIGRLAKVNDTADSEVLFSYDALDRLKEEITERGAVRYGYDVLDRRSSMLVTGQDQVDYVYDANSRLTEINQGLKSVGFDYDTLDRRIRLTLPNGVATTYEYDAASQLTRLAYFAPDTSELGDLIYRYDAAGNRVGVGGSFARVLLPDAVAAGTYDEANRQLTFGDREMTYDANGNLTSITQAGDVTELAWDARDRLTALNRPNLAAAFAYDAFDRRTQKAIDADATEYLYDGVDVTQEQRGAETVNQLRSLYVDDLLAYGNNEYPLADALGSALSTTAANGSIGTEFTYAPYGQTQQVGADASSFQFTGRENDGTGFYYYRARYYHPEQKRFISEDPLGFTAGDINLYGYVGGDPVNYTDPSGENPLLVAAATCAAVGALEGVVFQAGVNWLTGRKLTSGFGAALGAGAVGGLAGCGVGAIVGSAARYLGRLAAGSKRWVNLASPKRTRHILFADATGGGHKFGLRRFFNGKTKFPASWSGRRIMHAISEVATDPSSKWIQLNGKPGSFFTKAGKPVKFWVEGVFDGVRIKVLVHGDDFITAYPIM